MGLQLRIRLQFGFGPTDVPVDDEILPKSQMTSAAWLVACDDVDSSSVVAIPATICIIDLNVNNPVYIAVLYTTIY